MRRERYQWRRCPFVGTLFYLAFRAALNIRGLWHGEYGATGGMQDGPSNAYRDPSTDGEGGAEPMADRDGELIVGLFLRLSLHDSPKIQLKSNQYHMIY